MSVLGYTSSASFWVDVPEGWQADAAVAKHIGAAFVLLPKSHTFQTAPAVVVASAYRHKSVESAMAQDEASFVADDPAIRVTGRHEVATKKGKRFVVQKFRSKVLRQQGYESVAYYQEGADVVVLTLSAQSEPVLNREAQNFENMLTTYESSSLSVESGQ